MRRRDAGLTLVEITAAVTVLGIAVALVIPISARSHRFKKVVDCQGNLHAMYRAQSSAPAVTPQPLGRVYWTRLTETTPPLISKETLRCPLVQVPTPPPVQYMGPAQEVSQAAPNDPIGCDLEFNHSDNGHEGGNVLLKSGAVTTDRTGIWADAIRYRKCRD